MIHYSVRVVSGGRLSWTKAGALCAARVCRPCCRPSHGLARRRLRRASDTSARVCRWKIRSNTPSNIRWNIRSNIRSDTRSNIRSKIRPCQTMAHGWNQRQRRSVAMNMRCEDVIGMPAPFTVKWRPNSVSFFSEPRETVEPPKASNSEPQTPNRQPQTLTFPSTEP